MAFAVWAPNAQGVSVMGDFCRWDERRLPMRRLGSSGVYELFVPGVSAGALYKYRILGPRGELRIKADPFAQAMELPPEHRVAGRGLVLPVGRRRVDGRAGRRGTSRRSPMAIYEVHLGSWARVIEEGNRPLTYREIAPRLIDHVKRLGFSHVEFMPLAEHPFTGSWGYQVSAYFAPTARYGTPDDLRYLIDACHHAGIGVIMDWVPAHFPKDDFALRLFDGTALYEHEDPRRGEHPEWGTLIFNYGRREVRNFLIANALYWLEEFHVDGLRVDAVASMLYLDYGRAEGQWVPNRYGGREDLEAVEFLKLLNATLAEEHPGCFTVAEESTSLAAGDRTGRRGRARLHLQVEHGVDARHAGLLRPRPDPPPLSPRPAHLRHDVRVQRALHHAAVARRGGAREGDAARPRCRATSGSGSPTCARCSPTSTPGPGKPLLFMGSELGSRREWNHDSSLDWHLESEPLHGGLLRFLADLGAVYRARSELWRGDPDLSGFSWLDADDRDHSIYSYFRRDGDRIAARAAQPHAGAAARLPERRAAGSAATRWLLSSDDPKYGGGGFGLVSDVHAEPVAWQNQPASFLIGLPPLGAVLLAYDPSDPPDPPFPSLMRPGARRRSLGRRQHPVLRLGADGAAGGGRAAPGTDEPNRTRWRRAPTGSISGTVRRVPAGSDYTYRLDGGPDRPDPVSRWLPRGVHGPTRVVDPAAFHWTDAAWRGSEMADLVIYELHVGTFTPAGTFDGASSGSRRSASLASPRSRSCPSRSFPAAATGDTTASRSTPCRAPTAGRTGSSVWWTPRTAPGSPCCSTWCTTISGPRATISGEFGPYFSDRYRTAWGEGFNLDGPDSDEVRRYLVDNAVYWVTEYHLDGLRLDAADRIVDLESGAPGRGDRRGRARPGRGAGPAHAGDRGDRRQRSAVGPGKGR